MSIRDTTVQKFTDRLDGLIAHHSELKLAIHNKRNETTLEKELVTQFVLQASVFWESFQNDLLLAYIEMSPSKALGSLEQRVKQSVEGKFGKSTRRAFTFTRPGSPTRKILTSMLDHRGWNISATNSDKLASKANDLLASRFAKKFSLDSENSEFYDYAISLRNFLSHYSSGARVELQNRTNSLSEPANMPLKAQLGNIGNYLKVDGGAGVSRAEFVVSRFKNIANIL